MPASYLPARMHAKTDAYDSSTLYIRLPTYTAGARMGYMVGAGHMAGIIRADQYDQPVHILRLYTVVTIYSAWSVLTL